MTAKVDELFGDATPSSEIVLVSASSVTPKRVDWAWDQRSPIGMAGLIVGEGGLGKSLLVVRLAAGWSRGIIPGAFFGSPVHVAIASAEDHRQAVLLPRLLAAGADLSRIHFIEHRIDGETSDIAVDGEVAAIESALVAGKVRALLIDTVIAHIPAEHDTYNEQRVRAVLKPLAKMAERNKLVVLGTMHLNRRDARDVLTRISGSGGFGNLARSVLLLARDPDDPDGESRILAIGKSNVGGRAPALKLALEPCSVPDDDGGEIPTVRLVDIGESQYTSSDLLGPREDADQLTALGEAADFLREYLADGPVEAKAVKAAAKDAGIAEKTLWRAAKRLRVKTNDRTGFGPGHPSRWTLVPTEPLSKVWPSRQVGREDGPVGNDPSNASVPPTQPSITPTGPYIDTGLSREHSPEDTHTTTAVTLRAATCPQCGRTGPPNVLPGGDLHSLCARCTPITPSRVRAFAARDEWTSR